MNSIFLDLWQKNEYLKMKPGLERIKIFLQRIGSPQKSLNIVHVAGTNGKGSVSKMIASVLSASGYKTALYTSPHLVNIYERIEIDGNSIDEDDLNRLAKRYYKLAKKAGLTFFEFITAVAIVYFKENKVDIAVLETGLGGRFDATNIFEKPLVNVITEIGYEHTEILGNTIEKIAKEKAGIIQECCPVVSGVENSQAKNIIKGVAKTKNAPLIQLNKDFKYKINKIDWKNKVQKVFYKSKYLKENVSLSLLGEHQAKNCSIALAALEVISKNGFKINFKKASKILNKVHWPGRFDIRKMKFEDKVKTLILDGAHNPSAIKAFVKTFISSPWGNEKVAVLFNVMKDKDYKSMVKILLPIVKKVILLPTGLKREISINKLSSLWKKYIGKRNVINLESLKDVLCKLKDENIFLVCGSLFLVGKLMKEIKLLEKENV
ncbi:MAG: bifunctional folylpolyglutamate synthase/dihydrofolate synthase [Elusimicrobia bacterium]|nr:bifunctional folylpolyglutamate synthase/dihydrofolate synthase [Elusimicrobiota bacterium]